MIYDLSRSNEFREQRDNERMPNSTCGPTSAVNASFASGIYFEHPEGMQPEDYIISLLQSQASYKVFNRIFPHANFNPWNTSYMIKWAINKAVGKNVCEVRDVSIAETVWHMIKEQGALVHGGGFTSYGHMVAVVGFDSDQPDILSVSGPSGIDMDALNALILDDPWGDYMSGYRDHNGDSVSIPIRTFERVVYRGRSKHIAQLYYPSRLED